jgi:predicted kinase
MACGGSRSGLRPRWILITGLPATGKSTLARRLAAHYAVPLLAKDAIKEALLDAAGPVDAARSRALSDQSFARLFAALHGLAAQAADAVIEGNFRAGGHEEHLRALPAPHLAQILCRCDEGERLARIAARRGDATRHPGHGDAAIPRDASNDRWLDLPGEQWLLDTSARASTVDGLEQRLEQWWRLTCRAPR